MQYAKKYFVIFVLVMIAVLLMNTKHSLMHGFIPASNGSSLQFNNDWSYRWETANKNGMVKLPCVVDNASANKILWISKKLPMQDFDHATLLLRTSEQYVRIYVDGTQIYDYWKLPDQKGYLLPGSSWHFVKLPEKYEGRTVEISLVSPYKQYDGNVNSIFIGSESQVVLEMIFQYGSILVISLIIFSLGIIMLLFYAVLKSDKGRFAGLLYLGMFSLLGGIWIASESKVIQFIVNSPAIMYNVACISLFLLPIPLLQFILTTYKPRKARLLEGFVFAFSAYFSIASMLQVVNNGVFMKTMFVFHIMLLLCIVSLVAISIGEMRNGNKGIRLFFLGCIELCVFSTLDLFGFYFSNIPGLTAQGYIQFGILILIMLLSVSLGHYILEIFNDQAQSKIYQQLAYIDILTGLKNRTSFEQTITKLNRKLDRTCKISLIVFDLNDLKLVNDTLGHQEGDRYISSASKLISKCFGDIGQVFRIGGDEFVVIAENDEAAIAEKLMNLDKEVRKYNSVGRQFKVHMAYGFASFKWKHDKDLYHVFTRADQEMYECKRQQKENQA